LLLFGRLLLATPVAVQAQFNYTTNKGTITITGYFGTDPVVAIPSTIDGLQKPFPFFPFFPDIGGITAVTITISSLAVGTNSPARHN